MTGLMLKDFFILRKALRSYLVVAAIYIALAFTGAWSPEFIGGFLLVMVSVLPMNVFAYDKQAKWDVYNLALPVGRTGTVAARYLVTLMLSLGTVAIISILGIVMGAMGRLEEPATYLFTCVVCAMMGVVLNAVLLPLLYKFGPERARIVLYGLMGAMVGAGWIWLVPLGGIEWLKTLGEPTPAQIAAGPFIAAAAGVVLLALSFLAARHVYGAKDV